MTVCVHGEAAFPAIKSLEIHSVLYIKIPYDFRKLGMQDELFVILLYNKYL